MRRIKAPQAFVACGVFLYAFYCEMQQRSILTITAAITVDSDGIGDQRNDYRNGQTVGTIPAGAVVLVSGLGEIAETAFPLKNHKPPKSNAVLWL